LSALTGALRRATIAAVALGLGLVAYPGDSHSSSAACRAKIFHTRLVNDACARGGQAAAKAAMKRFMADAAKKQSAKKLGRPQSGLTCNSCHVRLAPDYPLTANGLTLFRSLGGS
jgi:hypothetical protein